jgi:hypothetical protein
MTQKKPQNISSSGHNKGFYPSSCPTITQTSGAINAFLSNQINLFCAAAPCDFGFR